MWVRISISARCTTLCDKICQWRATGQWFSPGPLVSSTNKTDRHDITEILLKVALNTIKQAYNIVAVTEDCIPQENGSCLTEDDMDKNELQQNNEYM